MKRQGIMARLLDRLQWRPLQVYLRHYRSAEIDISTIAVAYYLILTVFPLIVIAANVFPYLNIDTTDLLNFMSEHLPKQFYAPDSASWTGQESQTSISSFSMVWASPIAS